MGGLKEPCQSLLTLIINCEILHRTYRADLLHETGYCNILINKIVNDIEVLFPPCCNVKYRIVKHFFLLYTLIRSSVFELKHDIPKRTLSIFTENDLGALLDGGRCNASCEPHQTRKSMC